MSKRNESDIERIQKSALKVILKDKYVDLDSLHGRRAKLCLKFAKKCLKL